MTRPCFLVVDREFPSSISTRKLVIETAKMNVLTAYSAVEAVDTLQKFPAVDGVVLDAGVDGMSCDALVAALKQIRPSITIIIVDAPGAGPCLGADHYLPSFDPRRLLDLLEVLESERVQAIAQSNRDSYAHTTPGN